MAHRYPGRCILHYRLSSFRYLSLFSMAQQRTHSEKHLVNIKRVDYPEKRTHGWYVQVIRKGVCYKKFFSDSVYDGKKPALDAAIQYRDHVKNNSEQKYKLWRRSVIRQNNTSGIVGVGRYVRSDNKSGTETAFWLAFWHDKFGNKRSRKFSVTLYGEDQARTLAIRQRKKWLKENG